ncbi:spermidine synthase [Arcanobacterium ihumii]|uniref:spermidine synthase n=1 Tax=Arcanobacterium ihumii TaxID=2138162 RepID=UPI000F536C43|nr:fused MFS/spermidine synthase [Arcanobacterium ihumii]
MKTQREVSPLPQTFKTMMSLLEVRATPGDPDLLTLWVDGTESSAIRFSDPHFLEFEYMEHIRISLNSIFEPPTPLKVLHLGGGGCTLARALNADRPGSRQLAIEIDSELAQFARQWFDLPRSPFLRIRAEDARLTLDTNKGTWDVIVRDTFRHGIIPDPLRTVEAHQQAAKLLADGGIYCLNVAGHSGLSHLYEEIRALEPSFCHLAAISDPAIFKSRRFGNIILLASNNPIPVDSIGRELRKLPLPTSIIGSQRLLSGAQSIRALTDADVGWSVAQPSPTK